jgi:capsular polysaccharide biosynthesis protein
VSTTEQDVASRLGWGVRRYALVIVVAVIVTCALALAGPANGILSPERSYETSALVVARQLTIRPEQLPRAAEAVFSGGSVAETVAGEIKGVDSRFLIPERVRLEPVTDTIALKVIGRDRNPDRAAEMANLTAAAFVEELNRLGPGVGEFALQDQARPPLRTASTKSAVVPLAVGVISGLALGLGLVGLLLILRQPVIDGGEAAAAANAPLAAVVELPSARGSVVRAEEVSGLALLVRQLFPSGSGAGAVIGCGRDRRGTQRQVLRLVALLAARRRPVYVLVAGAEEATALSAATRSEPNIRVIEDWFLQHQDPRGARPDGADDRSTVLVGVSAADFDVPQLLPEGSRSLLFVPEGIRRGRVERAATQFAPGALDGVAFCRRVRNRRRAGTASAVKPEPKTASKGRSPAPEGRPVADVVEPRR